MTPVTIAFANLEQRKCPCGCGQLFPVFTGNLDYGPDSYTVFQAAHLKHAGSGPHVWLLLRTGPWVKDDARDCWVTLHLYLDQRHKEEGIVTFITDPEKSPFWPGRSEEHRYLRREEVLRQPGGQEWAIARRLEFERQHKPTYEFLNEAGGT